jgi:hypothetical protein
MKVFGIGLNKTGTKTLNACFKSFGLTTWSYDLQLLKAYSEGRLDEIFRISDAYDSFEDWPWPLLYKEFDRRYPEAKFILAVRKSPEHWFDSLCRHADRTGPTEARQLVYHHEMPHQFKSEHIDFYNRHNNEVAEYFAGREGKLLQVCWETGSGWKELAEFLGYPIPKIPFPHENHII